MPISQCRLQVLLVTVTLREEVARFWDPEDAHKRATAPRATAARPPWTRKRPAALPDGAAAADEALEAALLAAEVAEAEADPVVDMADALELPLALDLLAEEAEAALAEAVEEALALLALLPLLLALALALELALAVALALALALPDETEATVLLESMTN